jgi:mRNA interferase MazF
MRLGMSYSIGDIILIKFPFTDLSKSKKRPVLVIKSQNKLDDIVCLQITSNQNQSSLIKIENSDLIEENLTLESYVKYDKCFTLNSEIIDKKITKVNQKFVDKLKQLFCEEIF